jgi:hypothetical protein
MLDTLLERLVHTEAGSVLVIIGALGLLLASLGISKVAGTEFDWTPARRRTLILLSTAFILAGILGPIIAAFQRQNPATFRAQLIELKGRSVFVLYRSGQSVKGTIEWVGDDYFLLTHVLDRPPSAKDVVPFFSIQYVRPD